MPLPPNVSALVLCEDVRVEINNKYTLVGVFAGDIIVPYFPAPGVKLAVYAVVDFDTRGKRNMEFQILVAGTKIFSVQGEVDIHEPGAVGLATPQFNTTYVGESDLEVRLIIDDGKMEAISTRRVRKGAVLSPLTPPPPL
jgi:hypothetical protein